MAKRHTVWLAAGGAVAIALVGATQALVDGRRASSPALSAGAFPEGVVSPRRKARIVPAAERADAIARAQVWREPDVPVGRAILGRDPSIPSEFACVFKLSHVGGTTPKFDCLLPGGHEIRVKYGRGPEIPGEAAATRLLRALGFGADRVDIVDRLACRGCPESPFLTMKVVEGARVRPLYERLIDWDDVEVFGPVAVEQRFDGRPIETDGQQGWALYELDLVDADAGGAPRAHVDALRLMAVFLAHWDNKSENQRLVCLSNDWPQGAPCPEPFLLLQDVGATFGPRKVNLEAWRQAPVWSDRATCAVAMRTLPYSGGTFGEARISEAGRRFLGGLVSQLSDRQLSALFSGAGFDRPRIPLVRPDDIDAWVRAFRDRARAITEGPPCPA